MNSTAEKSQAGEAVSCHRGRSARKVSKTVVWLNVLLYTGLAALCVIAHVGLGQPMGAFATEIQITETGLVPIVAPRGLDTETSSIVSDLAGCDATSDSAMPTPSDVYITETVDGATASLTVTPISALSTDTVSSCAPPQTITVTVTTINSYDAVHGTSTDGSSAASTTTDLHQTSSYELSHPDETTLLTSTTTRHIPTTSTTTIYTTLTPPHTATDPRLSLITLGTGTGIGTVVIGTATFTIAPSANGTFTYTPPSLAPVQTSGGLRSSRGNDPAGRGGGSGTSGYCLVMVVALLTAGLVSGQGVF